MNIDDLMAHDIPVLEDVKDVRRAVQIGEVTGNYVVRGESARRVLYISAIVGRSLIGSEFRRDKDLGILGGDDYKFISIPIYTIEGYRVVQKLS